MESALNEHLEPSSLDSIKLNETNDETSIIQDATLKSNGITAESDNANSLEVSSVDFPNLNLDSIVEIEKTCNAETKVDTPSSTKNLDVDINETLNTDISKEQSKDDHLDENKEKSELDANNEEPTKNYLTSDVKPEELVVEESVDTPLCNDNVRFETEVVVETNDDEVNEMAERKTDDHDSSNNLLSEINQSIELNEVLRSSDVTENVENNNCTLRQEVFNKEELLDILEGNDVQSNDHASGDDSGENCGSANLETKLALQQLSRLKSQIKHKEFKKRLNILKKPVEEDRKESKKEKVRKESYKEKKNKKQKEHSKDQERTDSKKEAIQTESNKEEKRMERKNEVEKVQSDKEEGPKENQMEEEKKVNKESKKKESMKVDENIVNALVRDWEDEEAVEEETIIKNISSNPSEHPLNTTEIVENVENRSSMDSTTSDGQNSVNKTCEDNQPQKRLGRVIKKKIIFDPDNPDTFTKRKSLNKNRMPQPEKEQQNEKDPPQKKGKVEHITPPTKSKSPVSKLQWKKPSLKNNKQNRRLTEVDKLLMDEGAVNMIYQLTPEAPKGKKNMKTKAEFIKKLQSSTPESKEMKFRERKKESKSEEGEPKKILSGKQRSSLGSSVKSPSACEDFETHSADDSIIYRRHSSSSYSSSCMSPRRLSDVDTTHLNANISQPITIQPQSEAENAPAAEVFQPDNSTASEIINKSDCLTIKRKLNSKLSLALTKRKRDNIKTEKPPKKLIKLDIGQTEFEESYFRFLSLKFDLRLAEICIQNTDSKCNVEILKEISEALSYVDMRKDISVTLLTSDCGTLCRELDLKLLLNDDADQRTKVANEITESVRSLLSAVEQHSKLLCTGVWGACSGLALALVALSDVAVAAEGASFALTRPSHTIAPLAPGLSAVITSCRRLQQSLVDDLMIFSRQLSSFEALRGGLINRTLISAGFQDQLKNVIKDIANQPVQTLLLKKKLLNLRKAPEDTFLNILDEERALMVKHWTSAEGQETIRASILDP